MKASVIVDTGFFVALLNRSDRFHAEAAKLAEQYQEREWVTSWPVMTEVAYLLPLDATLNLLRAQRMEGLFSLFDLVERDIPRISELLAQYRDQCLDLADVSLVVLAEYLGTGDILTCDQRDFSILRWGGNRPFNNLLLCPA